MIKFIRSEKNNTIYSLNELLNTGADEICELRSGADLTSGPDIARILIKFDINSVNSYAKLPTNVYLNLKIIEKTELGDNFEIEIFPIAEDWDAGSGRFIDTENNYPGSSWKFKKENLVWGNEHQNEIISGGGSWLTEITTDTNDLIKFDKTVKFVNVATDLKVNITDVFQLWLNNTIPNYGLLLKLKNDITIHKSSVKFFAKNTNTIYEPYLELHIEDYLFNPCNELIPENTHFNSGSINSGSLNTGSINSGSLNSGSINSGSLNSGSLNSGSLNSGSINSGSLNSGSINSGSINSDSIDLNSTTSTTEDCDENLRRLNVDEVLPKIKQIKKEYDNSSIVRINVGVREQYPVKKFENRMRFGLENYTNQKMYYSVIDAETEEIIIDYSSSTQVSCDSKGHFFTFDFNVCNLGRMYKFLIKTENESYSDVHIDNRIFKVI